MSLLTLRSQLQRLGASGPITAAVGPPGPQGGLISILAAGAIAAFVAVTSTGVAADSGNSGHYGKVVGLSTAALSTGFVGFIQEDGPISNPGWSWTAGDLVFLNGTTLSKIPPSTGFLQRVGIAQGPTAMVIDLGEPILL